MRSLYVLFIFSIFHYKFCKHITNSKNLQATLRYCRKDATRSQILCLHCGDSHTLVPSNFACLQFWFPLIFTPLIFAPPCAEVSLPLIFAPTLQTSKYWSNPLRCRIRASDVVGHIPREIRHFCNVFLNN